MAGAGFYNLQSAGGPATFGIALQMYLKGGGALALYQSAVSSVEAKVRLFSRNIIVAQNGSATFGPYVEIRHSGNTTVAADGTLKVASPIVKLFHNGKFETNDESEGCTVEQINTGKYLIKGCMGLNSDAAWGGVNGGFDIPKDRNGQPLIWLDFEVNADGSVLVSTYHRTYPNAPEFAQNIIDGVNDGEPVDITADQFVSVRVEMPAGSVWNQRQSTIQAESELAQNQE